MVARLSCRVAIAFLAFRKIFIMKTKETLKMTKLHYHKDKNFFMDWLVLNDMSTGEIALWHTLMNIGNRLGQKSVFNAPTSTVMRLTGLSKQGIINARKKLMERGFISFQKGRQNKAPVYEMIPLHQTIEHYFSFGSDEGLTQDLTQDLTPELTQDSTGDLTIHKVQNKKEKRRRGGRGCINEATCNMYEDNIGKLTPLIRDELIRWLDHFDEKIVEEAMLMMVKKGGKTFSYLEKILEEWKQAGLQTLEDVHAFELEKELAKNKKLIPFKKRSKQEKEEESLDEWLKEEF